MRELLCEWTAFFRALASPLTLKHWSVFVAMMKSLTAVKVAPAPTSSLKSEGGERERGLAVQTTQICILPQLSVRTSLNFTLTHSKVSFQSGPSRPSGRCQTFSVCQTMMVFSCSSRSSRSLFYPEPCVIKQKWWFGRRRRRKQTPCWALPPSEWLLWCSNLNFFFIVADHCEGCYSTAGEWEMSCWAKGRSPLISLRDGKTHPL